MARRPGDPTQGTLIKLFALSGNRCAFQNVDTGGGCEQELARPDWPRTQGQAAHIRGEATTAARFDATMTNDDRRAYENIILLCPTHHHLVDYLEPQKYTVDVLRDMKLRHEENAKSDWATSAQLVRYADLVLMFQFGVAPRGGFRETVGIEEEELTTTQTQNPTLDPKFVAASADAEAATGRGTAHDATVEGSTAVETDAANPGAPVLTTEDGTPIVTEDGDRILLEGQPRSEDRRRAQDAEQ
jgi:hypothetical protein